MQPHHRTTLAKVEEALRLPGGAFDVDTARPKLAELTAQTEAESLWANPTVAKKVLQEKSKLEALLNRYDNLARSLSDTQTLLELATAENDASTLAEAEAELAALEKAAEALKTQCLLGGEADGNNAFIEIHAGAGGTESCDWAGMLLRMYSRWAEHNGLHVSMIDTADGDQAGVKSATLLVSGPFAYGLAKTEGGVHRLVRISPFDSNARRHTSFASVFVYPELDDSIEVNLNMADVRIDTYRASGAGGQHVNKTDSAVRMTHLPSGIVVASQQDRSQHRNREICLKMLKARLYELEQQKQLETRAAAAATKTEIGWGHQIRSYVLQPYQMVKDLRTGVETSNTAAVLDGDLNAFIKAALAARVGNVRGA